MCRPSAKSFTFEVIPSERLPEIPIDSSLYSKPLCQTLSKAFEISKNTALISIVGLQSNVGKILWVISIN